MRRWAIFVHDPDGDSGEGAIVGVFRDVERACRKATAIQAEAAKHDTYIEAIVLPLVSGGASNRRLVLAIDDPSNFQVPL